MKSKTAIFVVGAPVGVMAAWLLSLVVALIQAEEVILPVTGLDPRSLISGQYLQYQVNYGMSPPTNLGSDLCACLTRTPGGIAKATWFDACSARNPITCPLFIRGRYSFSGMKAGIERYYFPEKYQHALPVLPPYSTIKVRVTKGGVGYVTGLFVDGVPLLEWVKSRE